MQKSQVGQKSKMSEEKFKRIVVASTVGAVLLLVILLSIMVYGIVKIFVTRNKIKELDNLAAYYKSLSSDLQSKTEFAEMKEYIIREAAKYGYSYKWNDD